MEQRINLYSGLEYFTLSIGTRVIDIDEPVGWDEIAGEMKRDEDLYGFNIEFISGAVKLKFAYNGGGGEELIAAYDKDGADALVGFEFGIQEATSRFAQFNGTVNLNDKDQESDGFTATVEKTSFESLLRTRYDTKVSLNATSDLDGNLIDPPPMIDISLHSKSIVKTASTESASDSSVFLDPNGVGTPYGFSYVHYLLPEMLAQTKEELEGLQSMPLAVIDHSPVTDSLYQYKATEAGLLTLNYSYSALWERFSTQIPIAETTASYYFYIERAGVIVVSNTIPVIIPGTISGIQPAVFNAEVLVDDRIYFGVEYRHTQTVKGVLIEGYRNKIDLTQQTIALPSICKGYRIIDLLQFIVLAITGKKNRVLSAYFDTGGPEEKNAITSGYAIRNFDVNKDKPVQASLKSLVDSLQAVYNIGVGLRFRANTDPSLSKDYIVIEPMEFFFRKNIITTIKDCYDWHEVHDKAHTYNEFDIGYSKYSKDEANTLDDANTEQSWLLPIRTYKAKLSKKCDLITSPYLIEQTRREQFKDKPSTSFGNDDELFLIAYTDEIIFPQIGFQFSDADNSVTFDRPVGMVIDDYFIIEGAVANAAQYFQVSGRKYDGKESYFVTNTPLRETGTGSLKIETVPDPKPKFAERNQYFGVMDNVVDAGSVYNVKYTCHRLLYRWAPLLNIGIDKKGGGELIRNTFSKNNGDMTSQMLPSAPDLGFGGTRLIREDANVILSDFDRESAPFSSSLVQCKAQVPYSQMDALKKALRGETTTDIDHGSVVMHDEEDRPWLMCVQLIKYDYSTGTAEFTVNKIEAL